MEYYAVVFKGESLEHASKNVDKRGFLTNYRSVSYDPGRSLKYTSTSIKPGVQGYDTEYSRSKEQDNKKEYEEALRELDVLVRNFNAVYQKANAIDRQYKGTNRPSNIKSKYSEYDSQLGDIMSKMKNIVDKYPALKSKLPSSVRTLFKTALAQYLPNGG